MNKRYLSVLLLVLICFSAFGSPKYYSHDSAEYTLTRYITEIAGCNPPSSVTPVSGYSLLKTLSYVQEQRLSQELRSALAELRKELEHPDMLFTSDSFSGDLFLNASVETYSGTDDDLKYGPDRFLIPYRDRASFLSAGGEGIWNNAFYGLFTFEMRKFIKLESDGNMVKNEYFPYLTTNLPIGGYASEQVTPLNAGIMTAGEGVSFFIGRGPLNIGYGHTGNMIIADNFPFQDFVKFSLDSLYVDYDFSFTHFDQQNGSLSFEPWMTFGGKHQLRISHTYSFNILDRVQISLTEATLVQSTSAFDLRMFNPFIFLHNWQGFNHSDMWANNIAGLELSAALVNGLTLDFQFVLDQIQLGSEVSATEDAKLLPNAMGFMLSLSDTFSVRNNIFRIYSEAVYTMPSLYLNDLRPYGKSDTLNYDFILGYFNTSWFIGDIGYTGYVYGPDTIVVSLGCETMNLKSGDTASLSTLLRIHGQQGIMWNENQNEYALTGKDNLWNLGLTGTREYMLLVKGYYSKNITKWMSLSVTAGWTCFLNYRNKEGVMHSEPQLSLKLKFHI